MPRLLVVDDEPNVAHSLARSLRTDDLEVLTALTGKQGLELVRQRSPDLVILDVRLTDMSGLDTFAEIRQIDSRLPVIIITAYSTTETAIEAMKRGAFEYLLKPLDLPHLREVVSRAIELSRLRHVPALFGETDLEDEGAVDRIVGRSAPMQEVYKAIGRAAPQDVPVLIWGESGTGKELVARALYQHSSRSQEPFLAINCSALPEALLESELFGHERGAFTGADRQRIGRFEQAQGGTIFLDEIGDLTLTAQPKILRLLQEQQFQRLGGNETLQTDVRIIAATNRDLDKLVAKGRFRPDLLYRLKVFTIRLPPLRERLEDLPLLIDHFIKSLGRALGKRVLSMAPEAMELLRAHSWPGNVRELQSIIKYALIQSGGDVLTPACFPEQFPPEPHSLALASSYTDGTHLEVVRLALSYVRAGESEIYRKICMAVDRAVIGSILKHTKNNQVQASELLGISRNTLRYKLRALGMDVDKHLSNEEPHVPD
jgi:DNA-binding NtrC family response regulator